MHQTMTIERTTAGWRQGMAAGLGAAWRERRLVLIVWLGFLLLGLFAVVPTWRGYHQALAHAPEGDRLLAGLNLALLMEMTTGEAPGSVVTLPWMIVASLLAALAVNPFVSGGAIAVLTDRADARARPVRERFFAGGARHYWPLARLLLLVLPAGLIVMALAGTALVSALFAASARGAEVLTLGLFFATVFVLAAIAGVISLVLDFARIAMVRDRLRVWGALWTGLRMLFRRLGTLLAFSVGFGLLLALAAALFLWASNAIAFNGWGSILLAIALQQTFALARTWLRVAMIAGELRLMPPPETPPEPAREPAPAPPAPVPAAGEEMVGLS